MISGDLATAFRQVKGLFLVFLEELWDGLREMPMDGGRRFVRTLQSATWVEQGGTIRICVDRLDEPIGLIEFDLLPILAPDLPGILKPFVGVDLEIYRDTHIEIDHSAANEGRFSITFTPGTTNFDFTSLLNIICLPDDIWLTRVAVQDSTIIIDGSLDQDGGGPRRYEIRGGRAYIYLPYFIGTSVHYQLIEVKDLLNCVR